MACPVNASEPCAERSGTAGELLSYGTHNMVLFCYGPVRQFERIALFIGGLGDGLLTVPYLGALAATAARHGRMLVQPLLRSCYLQYGVHSLDDDVADMDEAIATLAAYAPTPTGVSIVLIGHSTGCQDTVHYLKHGRHRSLIKAVVLQAAVSDRCVTLTSDAQRVAAPCSAAHLGAAVPGGSRGSDYIMSIADEEMHKRISDAAALVAAGRGDELMPRWTWSCPVTASRFHSLAGRCTQDDMFSADLSDAELRAILGHVAAEISCLWCFSLGTRRHALARSTRPSGARLTRSARPSPAREADQYVPAHVPKRELGERLAKASGPHGSAVFLDGADHNLGKSPSAIAELCAAATPLLRL